MKFLVQMKDPDGVSDSIDEAARDQLTELEGKLSEEERDLLFEARRERIGNATRKWFKWGEYLTVEIDTDAGTCVVVETKA